MTVSPPEIWDPNLEGESSLSQNTQYRLCNLGEQEPWMGLGPEWYQLPVLVSVTPRPWAAEC